MYHSGDYDMTLQAYKCGEFSSEMATDVAAQICDIDFGGCICLLWEVIVKSP